MSALPKPCLVCGTISTGTRCPSCARTHLRGYDRAWRRVRLLVLQRDGWCCHWCGRAADTADHLVPLAAGGDRLDPANLVAACRSCNSARSNNPERR